MIHRGDRSARGKREHGAGLVDGGHLAADVAHHVSGLLDEVAVGARHLAAREVEIVLEPDADVAAKRNLSLS